MFGQKAASPIKNATSSKAKPIWTISKLLESGATNHAATMPARNNRMRTSQLNIWSDVAKTRVLGTARNLQRNQRAQRPVPRTPACLSPLPKGGTAVYWSCCPQGIEIKWEMRDGKGSKAGNPEAAETTWNRRGWPRIRLDGKECPSGRRPVQRS